MLLMQTTPACGDALRAAGAYLAICAGREHDAFRRGIERGEKLLDGPRLHAASLARQDDITHARFSQVFSFTRKITRGLSLTSSSSLAFSRAIRERPSRVPSWFRRVLPLREAGFMIPRATSSTSPPRRRTRGRSGSGENLRPDEPCSDRQRSNGPHHDLWLLSLRRSRERH